MHSVFAYRRSLFTKKVAKSLMTFFLDKEEVNELGFYSHFQSRIGKASPEIYILNTLLDAVKNSEEAFKQYPVDERSVKALVKDIFLERVWMMRDPVVALVEGKPFIVGGRHRLNAIASTFAALTLEELNEERWSDEAKEERFAEYLHMEVRVDVLHLENMSDLLALITADNESRVMRKAEQTHLHVQHLGADSTSADVGGTVISAELTPREAKDLAAQAFTRRSHPKLKQQTKQVLGEKIATYVLFGVKPGERLSAKSKLCVKTAAEFTSDMNDAWTFLLEEIDGKDVVARAAGEIAECVVSKLSLAKMGGDDDLFYPGAKAAPLHEFEVEPVKNTTKGDSYDF